MLNSQTTSPPELWDYAQLAEYLGCAERTVRKWTAQGSGPKAVRIGRSVRFRVQDVAAWLDQKTAA